MQLALSKFAFQARRAVVFTLCSVSFALIALSAGERDTHGEPFTALMDSHVETQAANAALIPAPAPKTTRNRALAPHPAEPSELYRQLQSGYRSSDEITNEFKSITGSGSGLEFNRQTVDRVYKLSMVLIRVGHNRTQSGASSHLQNPLDVLFIHTLPSHQQAEDDVTFFNRKIDGVDERNFGLGLNLSRIIEMNDSGEPVFSDSARFYYKFDLKSNRVERDFDLREPKGFYEMGPARTDEIDPLRLLTQKELPFDLGLYGYEIVKDGRTYLIHLTVRHTEVETLTFEINMQELGSSVRRSVVLVYEEL